MVTPKYVETNCTQLVVTERRNVNRPPNRSGSLKQPHQVGNSYFSCQFGKPLRRFDEKSTKSSIFSGKLAAVTMIAGETAGARKMARPKAGSAVLPGTDRLLAFAF
jgi:hypothetical protein